MSHKAKNRKAPQQAAHSPLLSSVLLDDKTEAIAMSLNGEIVALNCYSLLLALLQRGDVLYSLGTPEIEALMQYELLATANRITSMCAQLKAYSYTLKDYSMILRTEMAVQISNPNAGWPIDIDFVIQQNS